MNTNSEDDRFWNEVAGQLRRQKGLHPPSHEEADEEMAAAGEAPVSKEELERVVASATSKPRAEKEELLRGFEEEEPDDESSPDEDKK